MRRVLGYVVLSCVLAGCAASPPDKPSTVYVPAWAAALGTPVPKSLVGLSSTTNGNVRDGFGTYVPGPGYRTPTDLFRCIWAAELGTASGTLESCPGVPRFAR